MNAFLVLTFIIMSNIGPTTFEVKLPFPNVAVCEAYIASPEQIDIVVPDLKVVGADIKCEPRQDGKPV